MKNYLKRNKPLLFLPFVLLPFIVLIFYVLGGGTNPGGKQRNRKGQDTVKGANYSLPEADRSLEIRDKTEENSFSSRETVPARDYHILEGDTLSEKDSRAGEPVPAETGINEDLPEAGAEGSIPSVGSGDLLEHIRQREARIRTNLEAGRTTEPENRETTSVQKKSGSSVSAVTKKKPDTPEQSLPLTGIEELDSMFRQNRELARQNDSLSLQLKKARTARKQEAKDNRTYTLERTVRSGFKPDKETPEPLLKAEICETTTVLTGNRVKLRLLEEGQVNNTRIPAGTFLYGVCEVNNERLQITVRQIPAGNCFLPVAITVYDLDGLPGLYVPDNVVRKVTKEAGGSANTSTLLGSSENALAYAGIQAADRTARSLLRTVRLKRVTLKKNTQVFLINKSR